MDEWRMDDLSRGKIYLEEEEAKDMDVCGR